MGCYQTTLQSLKGSSQYHSGWFSLHSIDSVSLKEAAHKNCRTKGITHLMNRRCRSTSPVSRKLWHCVKPKHKQCCKLFFG